MLGGGSSVKFTGLLTTPETVTTIFPVVVPEGTGTVMLVGDHAVGVAEVPLKVIVLDPCGELNPLPVTVTEVPMTPTFGVTFDMTGPG